MKVYRLSKRKYSHILNGRGAAKFGNRWNSKGTEIIYCSESRALAMAEVAVHLTLATLPSDYVMIEIDIPDSLSIEEIKVESLSKNWNSFPHIANTQEIGDDFVEIGKNCLMRAPSAVV